MAPRAALAGALLLAAAAAPVFGAVPAEPGVHVHIDGFAFLPHTASLLAGEWVTWHNHDRTAHRAVAEDLSFETPTIGEGETALTFFGEAATVPYICEFHTSMTGTIVVSAPGAAPDLVVAAIVAREVVPGVLVEVNVTVRNLGLAEAGPSTLALDYRYHGQDFAIGEGAAPGLGPGASGVVTVPWRAAAKVGDFRVRAVADANGAIQEADEENNEGQAVVSVLLPGFPGLDLLRPL